MQGNSYCSLKAPSFFLRALDSRSQPLHPLVATNVGIGPRVAARMASRQTLHPKLGKVREVKSNALERRHLLDWNGLLIGNQIENNFRNDSEYRQVCKGRSVNNLRGIYRSTK